MNEPASRELAGMIDHAILAPQATLADLRAGCELVKRLRIGCLCVRPCDVAGAAEALEAGAAVGTVIGFPHGAAHSELKIAEAVRAVADGADELDMVLNVGRLRDGDVDYVGGEIAGVVGAAGGRIVKVILECCYLNREQMAVACEAAERAGAHFVKTSTGFGASGATAEEVRFLRRCVGDRLGVKAAGGIRTLADALRMIEAGATRIGTSSTEQILADLAVPRRG